MKNIIMLLLCLLLCGIRVSAQSGDSVIYISIADSMLTGITADSSGHPVPVFTNSSINSLLSGYTFSTFERAYPMSRYPYLQQIYKVVAGSSAFATILRDSFPALFPYYDIQGPMRVNGQYIPNDFQDARVSQPGLPWQTYTWYLDFIHATEAWNITKGDPGIIIGVTDNGFFVNGGVGMEGNPDLNTKVAVLETNNGFPSGDQPAHGTMVAGLIAGATDNGIGYPSIGFNCRLDLSSTSTDDENLFLSITRKRRIINSSWYTNEDQLIMDPPGQMTATHMTSQLVYDEIYENGTVACFGAGNTTPVGAPTPWEYEYPASLDHNISVTNVMGDGCSWVNAPGGAGCCCDQHNITTGDTSGSIGGVEYHHNLRVDICAPAAKVGGLTYNPSASVGSDDRYYSHDAGWGTSFASPLVAGTLGLMLSVNPSLSPYQLEYALKMSSRDIYGVPDNQYLFNIDRFHSRAGAGALDADAAIEGNLLTPGGTFPGIIPGVLGALTANDAATQSFFIKGIEFNTICAPGLSTNSINPKLVPIYENGVPPYTFRWDPILGNTTTLDDPTLEQPTIIAATGTNVAYYRLAIYDASPIQKVANRIIRIQLQTSPTYTLGMRDSYLDMLDQPNSQATVDPWEWNIWESPDIWNRQVADGSTTPQDIQYFSDGSPNYMYVRVRNVGCADYTGSEGAFLHAYWTLGSTGENWSQDWTLTQVAGVSGLVPGGGEITPVSVGLTSVLHPGGQFTTAISWHPVDPELYLGSPDVVEQCGLARIVEIHKSHFGMAVPEVATISDNVRNNKNIVTRNMNDVYLGHKSPRSSHLIYVANAGPATRTFSLQMLTDRDTYKYFAGNLSEYMYIKVKMQDELFSAWQSGGSIGNYASVNVDDKSVIYDLSTPLRLDSILLDSGAKYYVNVSFIVRDSVKIKDSISHQVHFRQLTNDGTCDHLYGDFSFAVNIAKDPPPPPGVLAVTEISNGPSGDCEYVEMIVVNCGDDTAATVNVEGWIVDDNSGNFNNDGCGSTNTSSTKGHYRLAHAPMWENVPVGSIIVLYNHDDNCYNLVDSFHVDTTVSGLVYWIPIGGTWSAPYGTPYIERYFSLPSKWDCVYCSDSAMHYQVASSWVSTIGLNDAADAIQVRCPGCDSLTPGTPGFYHGIGYGPSTGSGAFTSIDAGDNDLGGPVKSGSGAASKYVFVGTDKLELGLAKTWTKSAADAAGAAPSTLGKVASGFRYAVINHSLGLPCCASKDSRKALTGSSGNSSSTTAALSKRTQQISVYPNPANTTLYFQFPVSAKTTIRLLDISGRLMDEQVVYNITTASFDLKAYAQGLYLYQVITDNKTQSGKILIEK